MLPKYVNIGAPFDRDDGSIIETDEEFVPTARELQLYAHKLEPASESGAVFEDPATGAKTTWSMTMHPDLYLSIYPQGPHAPAARAVSAILIAAANPSKEERRAELIRQLQSPAKPVRGATRTAIDG